MLRAMLKRKKREITLKQVPWLSRQIYKDRQAKGQTNRDGHKLKYFGGQVVGDLVLSVVKAVIKSPSTERNRISDRKCLKGYIIKM